MFKTNLAKTGLILEFSDSSRLEIHPLHGDRELAVNIDISRILMKYDKDAKIKLMPIISEKDMDARKSYFPNNYLKKYPRKNPDVLYNGKAIEYESASSSKSSIQNAIKNGKKQAEHIVIRIPDDLDMQIVDKVVKGQLKHYEGKENLTVWVINSTEKVEYKTKQKQ